MTSESALVPNNRDEHKQRLTVGLYLAVVFLFWMAHYIFVPTLPAYVLTKTNNLAVVGGVLSMYGLWQAVIRLPLGIAADWLGRRKPFILAGLACTGCGAWVMASASDANGLAVGRAITGLAAGTWVLLLVAFSSLFPPKEAVRASALLTLCNSIGRILGTSMTGWLNNLGGYTLPFFIAVGLATLSFVIMLPVSEPRHDLQRPSVGSIGRLILRRDVLLPSLLNAVIQYASWSVSLSFLPVLAKQMGASGVLISLFTTMYIALMAVGSWFASSVTQRVGAKRQIYASFVIMFVGLLLAALAPSLEWVVLAQLLLGLAWGMGYPVFMGLSIQYVTETERATAMGLHQAVYAIGMFAGPAFGGVIADAIGIQPMFGATAFACLSLGVLGASKLVERT